MRGIVRQILVIGLVVFAGATMGLNFLPSNRETMVDIGANSCLAAQLEPGVSPQMVCDRCRLIESYQIIRYWGSCITSCYHYAYQCCDYCTNSIQCVSCVHVDCVTCCYGRCEGSSEEYCM